MKERRERDPGIRKRRDSYVDSPSRRLSDAEFQRGLELDLNITVH